MGKDKIIIAPRFEKPMNLKTILICLLLISSTSLRTYGQLDNYFLPFADSSSGVNRFGYTNQNGEIVIPAKYLSDFYVDTLWQEGSLRTNSPKVIAIKHQDSIFFQAFLRSSEPTYSKEDRYRYVQRGKIGFLNAKREVVILPKYDFVSPFKNRIAEYYTECDKLYIHDCWYFSGDYQTKGYLNTEGIEYSEALVELHENGNVSSAHYGWQEGGYSCASRTEAYTFRETGELSSFLSRASKPDCGQAFELRYKLDEKGDTVHLINKTLGKLNGSFILGHYDYFADSTGKNRIYGWHSIHSLYSDNILLDFVNSDLVFLNKKFRRVSENRMIRFINKTNLKWKYTYLPQQVYKRSGAPIKFIIHSRTKNNDYSDNFNSAISNILKNWVSREFNRLRDHSEKISIARIDTVGPKTKTDEILKEIDLSHLDGKRFVRSFSSEVETEHTVLELPNSSIKITSHNGDQAPTFIWFSMTTGDIYLERDVGQYFKFKKSDKLIKRIERLLKKYEVVELKLIE